jgi:hypothetical protein
MNQSVPRKKNARGTASGLAAPQALKRIVNQNKIQKRKMTKEIALGTARGPAATQSGKRQRKPLNHARRRGFKVAISAIDSEAKVRPRLQKMGDF